MSFFFVFLLFFVVHFAFTFLLQHKAGLRHNHLSLYVNCTCCSACAWHWWCGNFPDLKTLNGSSKNQRQLFFFFVEMVYEPSLNALENLNDAKKQTYNKHTLIFVRVFVMILVVSCELAVGFFFVEMSNIKLIVNKWTFCIWFEKERIKVFVLWHIKLFSMWIFRFKYSLDQIGFKAKWNVGNSDFIGINQSFCVFGFVVTNRWKNKEKKKRITYGLMSLTHLLYPKTEGNHFIFLNKSNI